MPAEFTSKRIASFDGAEITYHVAGNGGTWVVVANGLGGGTAAWRHQIAYLGDQVRFLAWDYRGLFTGGSDGTEPRKTDPAGLVDTHVRDLQAVLQAEDVQGGVWMGWSFGAQVLLEAFRRRGPRPDQIVLLNPCYGRRPQDPSGLRRLLPHAMGVFEWSPEVVERLVRRAGSWPETASWLKRLGFVASAIDEDELAEIVRHFRSVDTPAFLQSLRAAASHRVDGILGGIDVPTLVILGERDWVTPRSNAEPLARQIPNVELFVVRNGTHFVLLEFPELINLRVEKFLREHAS
jgi:3-oxoadipate enol-lactonase